MGNKNQRKKALEHRQKDAAKQKKFNKAVDRQVKYELHGSGVKATFERERTAVIVFMIGLMLVGALLVVVAGALIYG